MLLVGIGGGPPRPMPGIGGIPAEITKSLNCKNYFTKGRPSAKKFGLKSSKKTLHW